MRVFEVSGAAMLTLKNLTVANGNADYGGGIANNDGTTRVSNSTISGNNANLGGGGISNGGTLTVTGSTISGNRATDGGGIYSLGTTRVSNSTISGNNAGLVGGGIYGGDSRRTLTVTGSTISGNRAADGGGISSDATNVVINSTLFGNTAARRGGGIFNEVGTYRVRNSTISGNGAKSGGGVWNLRPFKTPGFVLFTNTILANSFDGKDCLSNGYIEGPGEVFSNNLIENDNDGECIYPGSSSLSGVDPKLGPLADNGGPTKTLALLKGSPAINKGNSDIDGEVPGLPPFPLFDQRGEGFPRIVGPAVDIGAFEVQAEGEGSGPPPAEVPDDKQACKKGGYEQFGFKNQGQCIKAANHAS